MSEHDYTREKCSVCGCLASPRAGNDLTSLIAANLPGLPYGIRSSTTMSIAFEKDLTPEQVLELDDAVATWVPPEYCEIFHFPP